jgi:hypothetical protein
LGRSKTETYRARREVVQFTPDHRANVKTVVGTVQVESFLTSTIIQHYIEAAGYGDYELLKIPVGMTAAFRAPGDIVDVVDPTDIEEYMAPPLNKSQIAPRTGYPRKFNDAAIFKPHYLAPLKRYRLDPVHRTLTRRNGIE